MSAPARAVRNWILGAAAVAALLSLARCGGRAGAEEAAERAAALERIRQLRAGVVRRQARIDALEAAARATDAPHEAAVRSTRVAEAAAERRLREIRTAIASDSLTLEGAREQLALAAVELPLLLARVREERAAAARRIGAYQVVVTYVQQTASSVDSLVDAQADHIKRLERGRPWWRRALEGACSATTTGGGAGFGAVVAGPVGAAGGAIVGLGLGALSCR